MVSVHVDDKFVELNVAEAREFDRIRELIKSSKENEAMARRTKWIEAARHSPRMIRRKLALRMIDFDDGKPLFPCSTSAA